MIFDHFFDRKAKITPVIDKALNTKRKMPGYLLFSLIKKDKTIQIPTIIKESQPYLFTKTPPS